LSYRQAGREKIIISFPEEPPHMPGTQILTQNTKSMAPVELKDNDSAELAAYFPSKILGYLSYDDEEASLFPAEVSVVSSKGHSKLALCNEEETIYLPR
jgi:hypothetical protein